MREPRPDWSPLGVKFKILDEHPHLFIFESPPPPPPPAGPGHCVVFFGKTLYSHSASLHPGVTMGIDKLLAAEGRGGGVARYNTRNRYVLQKRVRIYLDPKTAWFA